MRQKSFISEISVPEEDETSFVSESPSTTNDELKIKRKSFHAASFKTDNNPELVWSSTNFLFASTLSQKARMFYNTKNGLAFWYGQRRVGWWYWWLGWAPCPDTGPDRGSGQSTSKTDQDPNFVQHSTRLWQKRVFILVTLGFLLMTSQSLKDTI